MRRRVCKGLSTPEDVILKSAVKYTVLIWGASGLINSFAEKFFKVCEAFLSWSSVVSQCDKEDNMHIEYTKEAFTADRDKFI